MSTHRRHGRIRPRGVLSPGGLAALAAALLCAALLAACGFSSGGAPSTPASPSPTPVPSPLVTGGSPPAGAVAAARRFWTLVGEGKVSEAKAVVVAPGSPLLQWSGEQDGIASARFVRAVPDSAGRGPSEGATIAFAVDVWIEQHPSEPVLWGDPGEHRLFAHVVRMSDGTWRMWDSGTGP